MASTICDFVGASEIHKPLMPETKLYEATGYDINGKKIKLQVWAKDKLEAEKAISKAAQDVWPGSTVGGVTCS